MHGCQDTKILDLLIKEGAEIDNQNNKHGSTTLHTLCNYPFLFHMVLFLLNHGANPLIIDKFGNYPIDYLPSIRKREYLEAIEKRQNWVRRKSSMIFLAEHKLLFTHVVVEITEMDKPRLIQELKKSDKPKLVFNVLCCLSQKEINRNIISYI